MAEEKAIDFHDLINQATESMASGEAENRYTQVLVDEFQDISAGRMELLKVLQKPELAYFLVGDDWQSIYRFAGSRVSLSGMCPSTWVTPDRNPHPDLPVWKENPRTFEPLHPAEPGADSENPPAEPHCQ